MWTHGRLWAAARRGACHVGIGVLVGAACTDVRPLDLPIASGVHPAGWLDPSDANFHGTALRNSGWQFDNCVECHGPGDDPDGGAANVSCLSCHENGPTACNVCHGDAVSPAPPRALDGSLGTTARGVGAHRVHVLGGPTLAKPVACDQCHRVPTDWRDPGHILNADGSVDQAPAEVTFGALAGASLRGFEARRTDVPHYNASDGSCSNVYCHGSVLGGTPPIPPNWTALSNQANCTLCHALPPSTHAAGLTTGDCVRCHANVVDANLALVNPALHLDTELSLGNGSETCAACHGSVANAAPPTGLAGETSTADLAVGAHQIHLRGGVYRGPLACSDCHSMPSGADFFSAVTATGHLDSLLPAEVFPPGSPTLADADGALPVFNRGVATCGGVYCHGNGSALLADASSTVRRTVAWTYTTRDPMYCGTCHGIPPQDGRPEHAGVTIAQCVNCHATAIDANASIIFDASGNSAHIDGVVSP